MAEVKELIKVEEVASSFGRFKDAPWFQVGSQEIILGGSGGISSWAALFLARAGHVLYIYDNDDYDVSNTAGQFMKLKDVGVNKAVACLQNLGAFCDLQQSCEAFGLYDEDSMVSPIMMCGFDNMKARALMFEKWAAQEDRQLFIDGRQNAENSDVFCVQKGQEDRYRTELFSDGEIEEAPCSYKATSHTGAQTASVMVQSLNNYLSNMFFGIAEGIDYLDIRQIPFLVRDNAYNLERVIYV